MAVKIIHCGLLIAGTGEDPIVDALLVIDGDRVAAVGTHGEIQINQYPGAEHLDATSYTVLPGLVDAHAHICMDGTPDPSTLWNAEANIVVFHAVRNLSAALQSGVLTLRDTGAPYGISLSAKQAVADQIVPGPRLVVCGAALTMTGGHGYHLSAEADSPEGVRKEARRQMKQGADFVKLMATGGVATAGEALGAPQYSVEEMRAAAQEAHKAGKKCAAHAIGDAGIRNALQAGVDTIEHGVDFDQETIDRMLEAGVYLIPTFSPAYRQAEFGSELGMPEYVIRKAKQAWKTHAEAIVRAARAGVPIAAGTDAGGPGVRHGEIVLEIELMRSAGVCLTNLEAIEAATRRGAEALGLADQTGTLEAGKLADVLVVGGNPLENLGALRDIKMLIQEDRTIEIGEKPLDRSQFNEGRVHAAADN